MTFFSRWMRGKRSDATPGDAPHHIKRALAAAGLDARSGSAGDIRAVIDDALAKAGLRPHGDGDGADATPAGRTRAPERGPAASRRGAHDRFLHCTYAGASGRRDYRLQLPIGYNPQGPGLPLLVMLHGCTQSPEDFAVGTRMNALADRHGFVVAYPQQQARDNQAKCWNWFRPEDQRAESGEPSILAGMLERIATDHRIDRSRIFVAGLSAGAAMAVVLARTHPQLVRAIGVHSGLPYGAAHDVPSAFAAMQGRGDAKQARSAGANVPMIVFHGDADRTVVPVNADRLLRDAGAASLRGTSTKAKVADGHAYTREVYADDSDATRLERWTVHGAGHAWSGGDAAGSYTDPAGPDASGEMLRFFLKMEPRGG